MSGEVWRGVDDKTKLRALRRAARVGLDDIKAGRYRTFKTDAELRRFFANLGERAIGKRRKKHKP